MGFTEIMKLLNEKDEKINEFQELLHLFILHIGYEPSTKDKAGYIYFNGNKNAKRSHLTDEEEEILKKFLG